MLVFFIGCDVRYEKKIKKNLNLNDKLWFIYFLKFIILYFLEKNGL